MQTVESSLKGAALWDEVKDRLQESALGLSGGQQQRLCIARALAVRPEIILMDEPCSALDPIATAKVEELIDELKEQFTIVIVTHNMQQATRCSDMTAFFYLGNLIEFGRRGKYSPILLKNRRKTISPADSVRELTSSRSSIVVAGLRWSQESALRESCYAPISKKQSRN